MTAMFRKTTTVFRALLVHPLAWRTAQKSVLTVRAAGIP